MFIAVKIPAITKPTILFLRANRIAITMAKPILKGLKLKGGE